MKRLISLAMVLFCSAAIAGGDHHNHEHKKHKHDHGRKHKSHGHKAHVHGKGNLNVVVAGNEIQLEFEIPMESLVGFEHKPKTKTQKKRVAKLQESLKDPANVVLFDKSLGCALKDYEEEIEYDGDHSEWEGEYKFKCKDGTRIKSFEVTLLKNQKKLHNLKVQLVHGNVQKVYKLSHKKRIVDGF